MPSLTIETAAARPGPDWLVRRRTEAAEQALARPMPGTDEEVWRYSRVAELDLDEFAPVDVAAVPEDIPGEAQAVLSALGPVAGTVVVRNGAVVHAELDPMLASKGVSLGPLAAAGDRGASALGAVLTEPTDVFAALNDGFSADPVLLDVPAGVVVDRPILVIDWLDAAADGGAVFPRLVVRAGEDSDVRLVEWQGSSAVRAFSAPVVELDLAPAARVGYVAVQDRAPTVWQIASQVSRVERDASLVSAHVGLGGDYARARTDCRLVGRGASGNLLAAYFGGGTQTLDFRTFQEHAAPDTTSDLLFKGAVGGTSRSVYTGLIRVDKVARGTNAFQTNRNLKLSEHAWAESVPNLEIETNDVRCSHASTVGPIDEDQLFYLESRGVPTEVAERLVVAGFFDEVLGQLPVPAVADTVRAEIDRRLDAGVS